MNELIIVGLSLALGACVTWFVTWRYYQGRLASIRAERERDRQSYERETELLGQHIKHERRERRHAEDELRRQHPRSGR